MAIPKKVSERISSGLKHLMPIVEQQKARDVSEADTVTIVKDLLNDVFGYDKYGELTGEFAIRGTYCDLAIRLDDKITELIEVKAVGITLDERHLKQVIDYAANQGVEWVILTNGIIWRLYNVVFAKPIDKRLVAELDLMNVSPKSEADRELLYLFTKEGFLKGAHEDIRDRQIATSRYVLAALLLHNDQVLKTIRRELRRVVEVNVDEQEIAEVLRTEVIKRDALEDPQADKAVAKVNKKEDRPLRTRKTKSRETKTPNIEPAESEQPRDIPAQTDDQ